MIYAFLPLHESRRNKKVVDKCRDSSLHSSPITAAYSSTPHSTSHKRTFALLSDASSRASIHTIYYVSHPVLPGSCLGQPHFYGFINTLHSRIGIQNNPDRPLFLALRSPYDGLYNVCRRLCHSVSYPPLFELDLPSPCAADSYVVPFALCLSTFVILTVSPIAGACDPSHHIGPGASRRILGLPS